MSHQSTPKDSSPESNHYEKLKTEVIKDETLSSIDSEFDYSVDRPPI
jgi:hypothetical protein